MISLLLFMFIVGLCFCIILAKKKNIEVCESIGFVLAIVIVVFIGITIGLMYNVNTSFTIDKQIEMYQEENTKIESEVDTIVKAYMEYEKETFGDLKTEGNSITLVSVFPELKANELVQQQIQIYMNNNQIIKDLKVQQIEISKYKWLLYFGN